MGTEQQINETLDALEAKHGDPEPTSEPTNEPTEPENEPQGKHAPAFVNYEEWVKSGRDPADFKGENAFKREGERIKEIRDLKGTMNQVVAGMETWQQQQQAVMNQQIERAKSEAKVELERAKADDDTTAALAAQNKLHGLSQQQTVQPARVNPIINEFANKNPILDPNSPQYDAEFHRDMTMIHDGKLDQLLGGDRSRSGELTESQLRRVQNLAFVQTKELHADKFVSPKTKRQTSAQPSKSTTSKDTNFGSKLKAVSGGTRNPRDATPANDIYEMLKERDPKAAEIFAKNVIGED